MTVNKKEKVVITVPKYIKYAKLSDKRRAKYYLKGKKKPKKYADYKYNKDGILIDSLGNPVIANSKSVGTPRFKKINGQLFYQGPDSPFLRQKIVSQIKESFKKYVKGTPPIKALPVQIDMEMHDVVGSKNWDLDNTWIYFKCFQDVLVDQGVLPDDNILFVTKAAAPEFFPVQEEEDRKLVFTITTDTREIIQTSEVYKEMSRD